ncbi:MAG: tripartite tricarboxylate transporter substrate binding protein [Polaromonas sp.]|nr:tripartite tricarboxylate transporter substrate binding protein [Polaromonas sp.]
MNNFFAGKARVRRTLFTAIAALALASFSSLATAAYPDRPIKMVVAYPPGGSTDVIARVLAQRLGDRLGQPVVVENRAGAAGMIGTDYVAKSAADGYTIQFTAADTHSMNPHVYPKITYDSRKDFMPIGQVGALPIALIVNPSVQARNVSEFLALARKNPGKMTYASFGVGSSSQVAMEMLKVETKIDLLHVPFQGAAPAIAAIMGGQVDAMMVPLTLALPNDAAGKVRLLGVATPKRYAGAPNAPTFAEQGVRLDSAPWVGILAPARIPQDVADRLNREISAVLQDASVRETLMKNGVDPATSSQAAFKSLLDLEYDRWGATIKAAQIKVD